MRISLTIEHGKDATGIKKRVMWIALQTSVEGLDKISAVSELPDDSVLAREIDSIVIDMLALKRAEIKSKNKKIINEKKHISKEVK